MNGKAIGVTALFAVVAGIVGFTAAAGEADNVMQQIFLRLGGIAGLLFVFCCFVVYALFSK